MAYASYLSRNRHNSIFYARVIIPLALRSHFGGKREFRLSLRTPCKVTAKRRAMEIWLSFQVVYDALRNGKSLNDVNIHYGVLAALKSYKKLQKFPTPPPHIFKNTPIPLQRPSTKPLELQGLVLHFIKDSYRGQTIEVDTGCPEKEVDIVIKLRDDLDRRMGKAAFTQQTHPFPHTDVVDQKLFSEAADDYIELYKRNREYDKTLRLSTFDKESRNVLFWKHYFHETYLHEIALS